MDYVSWLFIHPGIHGAATVEIEWSFAGLIPGPCGLQESLRNDTKAEPNRTTRLCTIDILGMGLALFIEPCSHWNVTWEVIWVMPVSTRARKAPPALPLAVSEWITPVFLTKLKTHHFYAHIPAFQILLCNLTTADKDGVCHRHSD